MEKIFKIYKKNVKVYFQVLPAVTSSWDYVKIHEDFQTLYVRSSQDFCKGNFHTTANYRIFETDGILYKMFQDEIFDSVVKGSLHKVILGVDLLVFAFGQTGSGKSSTAHGLLNIYENRGLSPRVITELFEMREHSKKHMSIKFSISFIEIYRNSVVDLLKKCGKKVPLTKKNLKIVDVDTETQAFKLLFHGEANRNASNSKEAYISHLATTVFTIHVRCISTILSNPTEKYAKIHVIDMAGIDTSGNKSCEMKNALDVGLANLNKSQLEQCLIALQRDLVQEKESIKDAGLLVQYLGRSLGPYSNIRFIGHIKTAFENLHLTTSCLNFSNTARRIRSAKLLPTAVKTADLELPKVKDELEKIKEKMYLDSMLLNDDLATRITQPRIRQMEHVVEEYIDKKTNELTVINLTDVKNALSVFRNMYERLYTELKESMYEAALATIRAEDRSSIKSARKSIKKDLSQTSQFVTADERAAVTSNKSITLDTDETKRTKSVSEKASKLSKASKPNKSRRSNKFSRADTKDKALTGSITKSGASLETIMKHSYAGDISKSLRLKSKVYQPALIQSVITQLNLTFAENLNLENNIENQEVIWNNFTKDPTYEFQQLQTAKEKVEDDSINILINYGTTLNIMQNKVQVIDITKDDILKTEFYKNIEFMSKCGPQDEAELNKVKEKLEARIYNLNADIPKLKEELLTLQAELRINIEEFNRLKLCITKGFTNYCINKYHIPFPMDQMAECIQDKLTLSDVKPIQKDDSKIKERKNVFHELQIHLNKCFNKRFKGSSTT